MVAIIFTKQRGGGKGNNDLTAGVGAFLAVRRLGLGGGALRLLHKLTQPVALRLALGGRTFVPVTVHTASGASGAIIITIH